MKKFLTFKNIIIIVLAIISGNLLILNIYLWKNFNTITNESKSTLTEEKSIGSETSISNDLCPTSCIDKINEVATALSVTPTIPKSAQTPSTGGVGQTKSAQKEYFISLGSGSSQAKKWTDVPGAEAIVDGSAYSNIKEVNFQASLYTPTGNQTAWARLYNVSDKHPVWNSEVTIEGGTPKLLISGPITLENSSKTYRVQMKTQLGAPTNLVQGRIYISLY